MQCNRNTCLSIGKLQAPNYIKSCSHLVWNVHQAEDNTFCLGRKKLFSITNSFRNCSADLAKQLLGMEIWTIKQVFSISELRNLPPKQSRNVRDSLQSCVIRPGIYQVQKVQTKYSDSNTPHGIISVSKLPLQGRAPFHTVAFPSQQKPGKTCRCFPLWCSHPTRQATVELLGFAETVCAPNLNAYSCCCRTVCL